MLIAASTLRMETGSGVSSEGHQHKDIVQTNPFGSLKPAFKSQTEDLGKSRDLPSAYTERQRKGAKYALR